MTLCDLLLYVK